MTAIDQLILAAESLPELGLIVGPRHKYYIPMLSRLGSRLSFFYNESKYSTGGGYRCQFGGILFVFNGPTLYTKPKGMWEKLGQRNWEIEAEEQMVLVKSLGCNVFKKGD